MDLGATILDEAADLVLDRRGAVIPLRAQSMKVLRILAARPGMVVSKEELIAAVWGDVHVTDDSLTQCVGDIRRAIGDEGHRVLQTVPKRGYRLVPTLAPTEVPPAVPAAAARRRGPWLGAAAALILGLVGLTAWTARPAGPEELPSIAVLPFVAVTGEARWERLGRGFAAEVGADLVRSRAIIVIPAQTAEMAAGEPGIVGEALGSRFVLDGTLQAQRGELRVTARLTDAERGQVVWSDRWARPVKDLFAVQDEIVERTGGALDGTWTGALARAVWDGAKGPPTQSLDAYELYLLGAEVKHEFTPRALDRAAGHLFHALEIDPGFVQAMVTLSQVQEWRADFASNETEAAARVGEAVRLAEQAVGIDPNNPNALLQLANVRVLQGRRAEAWPLAAQAVEIAPTDPDVLAVAAWTYFFADQGQTPRDWAERAIALNPAYPDWYNCGRAMTALFAGDLDLAREAAREAAPMAEMLVTLGAAEALAGNLEEARIWFRRFASETRYRSLSALYNQDDISSDPAWTPLVEGTRLAGFPVMDAKANRAAQLP